MAAQTITHTGGLTLSGDAAFRAWGLAISTAIAAIGWVQTADTGQVNWTTVTNPTANTFTVYEIWRMADSLQSTDPAFIKIAYSRNAANAPRIQVTAGTATDGAGTITSAANTNTSITVAQDVYNSTSSVATTTTHNSYLNGDTSSLVMLLSPTVNSLATSGGLFWIERRRNVDGTAAAGGYVVGWIPGGAQSAASMFFHVIYTNNTYSQPAQCSVGPCLTGRQSSANNSSSNGVRANVVPAYPCFTGGYPELGAPSKWLLGVFSGDVPLGQTFQVAHYGATQTFMSVGSTYMPSAGRAWTFMSDSQVVPAVRID